MVLSIVHEEDNFVQHYNISIEWFIAEILKQSDNNEPNLH
jgi:hypothetical protein